MAPYKSELGAKRKSQSAWAVASRRPEATGGGRAAGGDQAGVRKSSTPDRRGRPGSALSGRLATALLLCVVALLGGWRSPVLGATETKTILFFGDSLTAGYGLDPDEAYPALIQRKIDQEGLPYRVVNAGLSGETTAGGLRRLDWILRQPVEVFVIELGGNDGLRGVSPATTQANLETMVARIRQRHPAVKIVIAGMQLPTNMGREHTEAFAAIYPAVAERTGATLIPFLLDRVGGEPNLNLPDGIHPTAEGHKIVAETVWRTLRPLL